MLHFQSGRLADHQFPELNRTVHSQDRRAGMTGLKESLFRGLHVNVGIDKCEVVFCLHVA